jgi:hypothetical protein
MLCVCVCVCMRACECECLCACVRACLYGKNSSYAHSGASKQEQQQARKSVGVSQRLLTSQVAYLLYWHKSTNSDAGLALTHLSGTF